MKKEKLNKSYLSEIDKELNLKYGNIPAKSKLDIEYYIDLITDKFKEKTIEKRKLFDFLRSNEINNYLRIEYIIEIIKYIEDKNIFNLI